MNSDSPIFASFPVCKLRLEREDQTDQALVHLHNALGMVDRGELLEHLLVAPPKGSAQSTEGLDDGYGLDNLTYDLNMLRQFMRTAVELMAVGISTRAQKLIVFIEKALTSLSAKRIVTHYKSELYLPTPAVQKLKTVVEKDIPNVWCQLAGAYEATEAHEKALAAYKSSLGICADHAVSLRAYARLTRSEFPAEVVHARALLKAHFDSLVGEFAGLRVQQGDGHAVSGSGGSSSNNLTAAISSAGQESAKKRAPKRKSDASTTAAAGALESLRQSLQSHVSQTPSLPVDSEILLLSRSFVIYICI